MCDRHLANFNRFRFPGNPNVRCVNDAKSSCDNNLPFTTAIQDWWISNTCARNVVSQPYTSYTWWMRKSAVKLAWNHPNWEVTVTMFSGSHEHKHPAPSVYVQYISQTMGRIYFRRSLTNQSTSTLFALPPSTSRHHALPRAHGPRHDR